MKEFLLIVSTRRSLRKTKFDRERIILYMTRHIFAELDTKLTADDIAVCDKALFV